MQLTTGDIDRQLEQLKRCELIKESEVKALCMKAREILQEEKNVLHICPPVTVFYFSTCLPEEGMWRHTRSIL